MAVVLINSLVYFVPLKKPQFLVHSLYFLSPLLWDVFLLFAALDSCAQCSSPLANVFTPVWKKFLSTNSHLFHAEAALRRWFIYQQGMGNSVKSVVVSTPVCMSGHEGTGGSISGGMDVAWCSLPSPAASSSLTHLETAQPDQVLADNSSGCSPGGP